MLQRVGFALHDHRQVEQVAGSSLVSPAIHLLRDNLHSGLDANGTLHKLPRFKSMFITQQVREGN